jgi:1,4-alpha-glucan branching enzyme
VTALRRARRERGELALVLHTHMPYVEGFGTWPFGEEWLWEAIATSYLPLLDVLGRAPITLSMTPVLCDQLEARGALERCVRFLAEIRPESHARDRRAFEREGHRELAEEIERSAAEYVDAARALEALGGRFLAELGAHAGWTSAATHAMLPLLATEQGARLQVQTGIASHRRRFGGWEGGFWLPECAHSQWLDPVLEEAGARYTCVELTRAFGLGDARHLSPLRSDDGPVLWPIDRQTIDLVWGARGYPASDGYRDSHRLTEHRHHVWRIDGGRYDHESGAAQAAEHARDFVARTLERLRDGGVCVCALDTELLGHWWYEGTRWLSAVIDESSRQGLALTTLDDALTRHEPVAVPAELGVTSWGEGGDLRTWSAPRVADLAWRARSAELALAAAPSAGQRALRELLALQSSDWAFLAYRDLAGPYPRERAAGHAEALERALAGDPELEPALRNLAPELVGWAG